MESWQFTNDAAAMTMNVRAMVAHIAQITVLR